MEKYFRLLCAYSNLSGEVSVKLILGVVSSLLATSVMAGQIELKNGDKIGGQLKSVSGENVVWKADKVGELSIKKTDINNINMAEPVKLRGFQEPCRLTDLADGMVSFNCADTTKQYSLMYLVNLL